MEDPKKFHWSHLLLGIGSYVAKKYNLNKNKKAPAWEGYGRLKALPTK